MRLLTITIAAVLGATTAEAGILQTAEFNGHTYHLLEADTWTNSEAEAVTLGGHLVTINDAGENTWIADTFNANFSKYLWIGFNDLATEGTWEWISGEAVTFTSWDSGQPDNGGTTEHWAHLGHFSSRFLWNDYQDLNLHTGHNRSLHGVVEIVPEPSTAMLIGVCTLFGFTTRRKIA